MKTEKNLIAALLLTGLSVFAGEPSALTNSEFLNASQVQAKKSHKNILNLNSSSLYSGTKSGIGPEEMQDGGLFANLGIFLPSGNFMNPAYESGDEKLFKIGFNLEVGNYFKFVKISKMSIGLRATWLSAGISMASRDLGFFGITADLRALTGSIGRVGPQLSIALAEKMGLDVFYQIGAQYTNIAVTVSALGQTESQNSSYLGATHEAGLAFRYSIFSVGFGYRFGGIKNIDNSDGSENDTESFPTNNMHICLGVRF